MILSDGVLERSTDATLILQLLTLGKRSFMELQHRNYFWISTAGKVMAYAMENDLQNNCLIQLSIALSIVDEQCLH